ncbi:MAG TPA: hypothetical protein VF147_10550, partial [Vicinamibacterales bacterium]
SPFAPSLPLGCSAAAWGVGAAWVYAVSDGGSVVGLTLGGVVAVPALVFAVYQPISATYAVCLLIAVRLRWTRRGIRCLVVHSNSAKWQAHVQTRWLGPLGPNAMALNWSERASWRRTLAVRVFDRFCGRTHNFNPAVVVFRGLRRPAVFRFYYAFQEAGHGRTHYLEQLEAQMFAAWEGDRTRTRTGSAAG